MRAHARKAKQILSRSGTTITIEDLFKLVRLWRLYTCVCAETSIQWHMLGFFSCAFSLSRSSFFPSLPPSPNPVPSPALFSFSLFLPPTHFCLPAACPHPINSASRGRIAVDTVHHRTNLKYPMGNPSAHNFPQQTVNICSNIICIV